MRDRLSRVIFFVIFYGGLTRRAKAPETPYKHSYGYLRLAERLDVNNPIAVLASTLLASSPVASSWRNRNVDYERRRSKQAVMTDEAPKVGKRTFEGARLDRRKILESLGVVVAASLIDVGRAEATPISPEDASAASLIDWRIQDSALLVVAAGALGYAIGNKQQLDELEESLNETKTQLEEESILKSEVEATLSQVKARAESLHEDAVLRRVELEGARKHLLESEADKRNLASNVYQNYNASLALEEVQAKLAREISTNTDMAEQLAQKDAEAQRFKQQAGEHLEHADRLRQDLKANEIELEMMRKKLTTSDSVLMQLKNKPTETGQNVNAGKVEKAQGPWRNLLHRIRGK